jgi:hypothetical protein
VCSRSATKALVQSLLLGTMLGVTLGGCSDLYFDRRDTISLASGEAMAANRATLVVDPWPTASGRNNVAYNGEKAAVAAERYRTGRVIPPVNATTSSAAYSQAAQQAQSTANSQVSSAPNGSSGTNGTK